jgi:hypothetical protein
MVEPVIGLAQPDQHRRIEPVLRFRPLDADQQHAAAPLYQDIAWLCGAGRSGRCGSRLRKRGAGSRKASGKRGGPGTGNHEVSARDAGGCRAMGVDHGLPPGR